MNKKDPVDNVWTIESSFMNLSLSSTVRYSLICYLGVIQLKIKCRTKSQGLKKLQQLIVIEQLGRFQSEGLGQIKWLGGQFERSQTDSYLPRRLKIRKGLPQYMPPLELNQGSIEPWTLETINNSFQETVQNFSNISGWQP